MVFASMVLKQEKFQMVTKKPAGSASISVLPNAGPREANAKSAGDTGYYERKTHPPPPRLCLRVGAEV